MKIGQRIYAIISLRHTGIPVSAYDRGTVVEYLKPKIYRVRTGFGSEKRKGVGRVKVHWDSGIEGWVDEDLLGN